MSWTVWVVERGGVHLGVHVKPDDDAIAHESSNDCCCGPEIEPVPREDGSMGWLISHHSLDGREKNE